MPTSFRRRWGASLLGVAAVVVAVALIGTLGVVVRDRIVQSGSSLAITVLSSRPDAITGGDARVRVTAPADLPLSQIQVTLNGADVTSQLPITDIGREGVVRGLTASTNQIQATAPDVQPAVLTLTNHPRTGPVFSGTQQQPYVCQTAQFWTRTGVRLGPVIDDSCSVAPTTSYVYLSSRTRSFLPLNAKAVTDPAKRPADLAKANLPGGRTQPFIVQVDTLTINRGVAQIAMLTGVDGAVSAWNNKLIYTFGGRCDAGYRQGTRTVLYMSPHLLTQGYALASNSLNAQEQNCNDVVAAEAFAMTREHFVETHGLPAYTMGIGCSGGAAQAYQTADNYPGLLDGIVVGCSLADIGSDVAQLAFDARLLEQFARTHPGRLTEEQLVAVSGLSSAKALAAMSGYARILDPVAGFLDNPVPPAQRYSASNPRGARATVWDQNVNVYGVSDQAGHARRPLGNVGVQYGLTALQRGRISLEAFIELNAGIGGLDDDLRPTTGRTLADARATRAAYASGRVLNGGGGLSDIPIIDYRAYGYAPRTVSLDMGHHTFVVRDRLVAANGDADNMVILSDSGRGRFLPERGAVAGAIEQMDRWLTALQALPYRGHRAAVTSKPADVVDACWTPNGRKIAEPQVYRGRGECGRLYPAHATPRMVAGGPLASNVISCALKPVDSRDYPAALTAAQLKRMVRIFPDGVCDWGRSGEGQRNLPGVWQSF